MIKSILKQLIPARIRRSLRVLIDASPENAEDFKSLRDKAVSLTTIELSQSLLKNFKQMVYHHAYSGNEDPHYQDFQIKGAVACTAAEANLLYYACKLANPSYPLEIGSYIGWSSAHIASALTGIKLTCVDPFLEVEDGTLHLIKSVKAENRFKENLSNCSLLEKINLVAEKSPDILRSIAPSQGWDWVFVDGWHLDGQPIRDVKGILPYLSENAVLFFHDLWVPDVRDATNYLIINNWELYVFDTSNYLAVCWKGTMPDWLNTLIKMSKQDIYTLASAQSAKYYKGLTESSLTPLKKAYKNLN